MGTAVDAEGTYVHQYLSSADDIRTCGAGASLQLATQGEGHGRSRGRTASKHKITLACHKGQSLKRWCCCATVVPLMLKRGCAVAFEIPGKCGFVSPRPPARYPYTSREIIMCSFLQETWHAHARKQMQLAWTSPIEEFICDCRFTVDATK